VATWALPSSISYTVFIYRLGSFGENRDENRRARIRKHGILSFHIHEAHYLHVHLDTRSHSKHLLAPIQSLYYTTPSCQNPNFACPPPGTLKSQHKLDARDSGNSQIVHLEAIPGIDLQQRSGDQYPGMSTATLQNATPKRHHCKVPNL
jgi:hypothetical protein